MSKKLNMRGPEVMRKYWKQVAAILAISSLSSSVFAAGEALGGFDLTAALSFTGTSVKETYAGSSGGHLEYGDQANVMELGLGYARSFGRFNLGVHAAMDTSSEHAGGEGDNSYFYELKIEKLWSLSLEPGLVLTDNAVAYLKMAYVKADLKANLHYSTIQPSGSASVDDLAFGFGVRAQMTPRLYLAAEALQYKFGEQSVVLRSGTLSGSAYKVTPQQTRATIKLGLVF